MREKNANAAPSMSSRATSDETRTGPHDGAILAADDPGNPGRAIQWFSWLFGVASLAAVIVVALHFSEEREFVRTSRPTPFRKVPRMMIRQ